MAYLFPTVCFDCRRSFKRPRATVWNPVPPKCPLCGGPAVTLGRKFKAPAATDVKQWEKVRRLVDAGFRFQTLWVWDAVKEMKVPARYPEKLNEADAFIRRFSAHLPRGSRPTNGQRY